MRSEPRRTLVRSDYFDNFDLDSGESSLSQ